MMSKRELKIANKLLTIKSSVKIKELSEEFNVGIRTIKYDLKNIRDYFIQNNIKSCSSSNKGIWVECSEQVRINMIKKLAHMNKEDVFFNQEDRIPKILFELLSTNNYITANYLAEQLEVSRNTILTDLDLVDILLDDNRLTLIRKQREGYKIKGAEIDIRTFYEVLIQKKITPVDVYNIFNKIKLKQKDIGLKIFLPKDLQKFCFIIERYIIIFYENNKNYFLSKDDMMPMIIRLIISFTRVSLINYLDMPKEIHKNNFYSEFQICFENLFKECNLPSLDAEMLYLGGGFYNFNNIDISSLTSILIQDVSKHEDFPYYEDATLHSRIISHLTLSFSTPSSNNYENPFIEGIIKNHYSLFDCIKNICRKHINNNLNDSFISYLVLHFLVSQKNIFSNKKYSAIFVCATGRGAAKLINRMIESEIPEIKMLKHCSLLELDAVLKELTPDIIISAFSIESQIPVFVVNSIPTKGNINSIKEFINIKQNENNYLKAKKSNILDFDLAVQNAEEISQEVIIIGLKIYYKIIESKEIVIINDLSFAFLTHIMLLANRYYFKKQYTQINTNINADYFLLVKNLFKELELEIEDAEVTALINYFYI